MKFAKNIVITVICILLGVMVSWQYKSIIANQKTVTYETRNMSELQEELIRETKLNKQLSERLTELQQENQKLLDKQAGDSSIPQSLRDNLEKAKIIAGLLSVKGEGVLITVDNGITQVDDDNLLEILNELRASDAQALAINDERIIATTEVRRAGNYIMINGKQMLAPFVIKAIADPEKLEHSLKIMNGIIEKLQILGIEVDVRKDENIIIPAVRDDGTVIKTDLLNPVE